MKTSRRYKKELKPQGLFLQLTQTPGDVFAFRPFLFKKKVLINVNINFNCIFIISINTLFIYFIFDSIISMLIYD